MRRPVRLLSLLASAALALGIAGLALAASSDGKSKYAELEKVYMLEASGTLVVAPDGSVTEAAVLTEFDDQTRNALARSIGRLRFEPVMVDGVAVAARTGFHAVLIGRKNGEEFAVTMDSIAFRAPKGEKPVPAAGEMTPISAKHLEPPKYPKTSERAGVMGQVKLVLRVGADGQVADVGVVDSQIWDTGVKEGSARNGLREFELEAVRAVRKWSFNVPADAASRSGKELTVATTIAFVFELRGGVKVDKEGQWLPVFKAPKRSVDWLQPADSERFADTALARGSLSAGSAFKLLTPVGGTSVF